MIPELKIYLNLPFSVNYISQSKVRIIEGELRCQELSEYLKNLNVKLYVWLSEDASGIVSKVEHDPNSNQLVGLVLPTDLKTGMPISFKFVVKSAEDINKSMRSEIASLVYVVMAQPIMDHAPPFILQVFGTNNKFTSNNVMQRWKHTIHELEKYCQ